MADARARDASALESSSSLLLQGRGDGPLGERGHHLVALRVRVQAVLAQLLPQETLVVNHRRIVVQVGRAVLVGVTFHPLVERPDLFGRPARGLYDRFTVPLL